MVYLGIQNIQLRTLSLLVYQGPRDIAVMIFIVSLRILSFLGPTLGRIAIRRLDGGWDFARPNEPYLPSGISDPHPSPASIRTTFFPSHKFRRDTSETSNSAIMEYKAQESRAAQMIRLGYDARDHDLEMSDSILPPPPPAYGQERTVATYQLSPIPGTLRNSIATR